MRLSAAQFKWLLAGASALAVLVVIALVAVTPRTPPGVESVVPGTNVLAVAVTLTQGTNHIFHYPDTLNWKLSELCRRMGWAKINDARQLQRHTPEPMDTFWVTCTHQGSPPDPRGFHAVVSSPQRGIWRQTCTGGVRDTNHSMTVTAWSLPGGMAKYHGGTLKISDTVTGNVLATIQVR